MFKPQSIPTSRSCCLLGHHQAPQMTWRPSSPEFAPYFAFQTAYTVPKILITLLNFCSFSFCTNCALLDVIVHQRAHRHRTVTSAPINTLQVLTAQISTMAAADGFVPILPNGIFLHTLRILSCCPWPTDWARNDIKLGCWLVDSSFRLQGINGVRFASCLPISCNAHLSCTV